jgi:hypothetical protein
MLIASMHTSGSLTVPIQRCSLGIINWRYANKKKGEKNEKF